jgi:predicted DNA-binding protein YlxM (UPF0122 family)
MLATNNAEALPKAGLKYESLLKQLTTFHLYLAPLNSLKYLPESHNTSEDIWTNHIKTTHISISEKVKLQDMAREIIREVIIVNVKESIKKINEAFKHTGFFSKDPYSVNANLEFELHLTANYAFMFQDYDEAINLYSKLYEKAKKVILI